MMFDEDLALQLQLQEQVMNKKPSIMDLPGETSVHSKSQYRGENKSPHGKQASLIDPSFEYIDPTPNVHAMFQQFNSRFFWGRLFAVEVKWSPRMTSCAGVCCYEGRGGLCSVRLSAPLLKLRPRKDLVETLLHEMIHAYLFVTNNDRDRDGHGPEFHKHMYRINKEAGTNISVYHSFHDEVKLYQQHWWRCNGPCQKWRPYYGMVKRAMNRAPGPSDFWWADHQAKCGGTYSKVREPEGFSKKKNSQTVVKGSATASSTKHDIRNYFSFPGEGKVLATSTSDMKANVMQNGKYSNVNGLSSKQAGPATIDANTSKNSKQNMFVGINSSTPGNVLKGATVIKNGSGNIRTLSDRNTSPMFSKNTVGDRNTHLNNNKNISPVSHSSNSKFGSMQGKGMLANKGGRTLVVTQKGHNGQTETKNNSVGDVKSCNKGSKAVAPFCGKGYTIGSQRSSHVPASTEKPWLALLDKIEARTQKQKQRNILRNERDISDKMMTKHGIQKQCKTQNSKSMHSPPKKFKTSSNDTNNTYVEMERETILYNQIDSSNVANSSKNDSVVSMVNCPTCDALVEESAINAHIDTCVQDVFAENVENFTSHESANCPICSSDIPLNEIDCHIDICLSNEGNSTFATKQDETEMVKCPMCDEQLLKCSLNVHLESCIQCLPEENANFIENYDECEDENRNGDDVQPCPVCMTLVKESLMNAHLDECLSANILKEMSQN